MQLSAASEVYGFLVTARSTVVDLRGRGIGWNSGFVAAAVPMSEGWYAELEIPLTELGGGPLTRWKINLIRRDAVFNALSELAPTFGDSGLDHYVPMFQSDPMAVERFADLLLR